MSTAGIILLIALFAGPIMSDVETPSYDVISTNNNIEVREYDTLIIAKVRVENTREESISQGFQILADYIFGNNNESESIAMTAPVIQTNQAVNSQKWDISFIMPSKYSLETLPKPQSSEITIEETRKQRFIVLRYSGSTDDDNVLENQRELEQYIKDNNINVLPSVYHAFYNPPWTLPIMRRNETMYQLY